MADAAALRWRLTLGPILIAALAALFWLDARSGAQAPWLLVLALLVTLRAVWEYVDLLRARGLAVAFAPLAALCALVVASNWLPALGSAGSAATHPFARMGPPFLAFSLAVLLLFLGALARYREPGGNLERLGLELLGLSYLAVCLSATVQLRWIAGPDLVYLPLASVVVATKCGDTAAFFAGRAIGGARLSPRISPGKTWAGAWGALAGAAAGSWLCFCVAVPALAGAAAPPWHVAAGYGVVVGVAGLLGDLAESLIKRDVGRKDSAPLLPGFGGLLDLIDSVIFAGPVALALWLVLPLPK